MQQKATQIEQKLLLVSSILPHSIEASKIELINFETQSLEVTDLRFVCTSPITRKTIRVTVEGHQQVSLFVEEREFDGDIEILDISLDAIKLKFQDFPDGLDENSNVRLEIELELKKKPFVVQTEAFLYRKSEINHNYNLVFMFKNLNKSSLVKYITKRQMELVIEIKRMQHG